MLFPVHFRCAAFWRSCRQIRLPRGRRSRVPSQRRAERQIPLLSHALSLASIGEHIAGDRAAARRLLDEAEAVTEQLDDVAATITLLQAALTRRPFPG